MNSRAYTRMLLLSLLVLTIVHTAHAEDTALGDDGYIRVDVGKAYVNLPSEKAVITNLGQSYGKTENRFWGEHVDIAGGLRLHGLDTTPADHMRFEVALNYLAADAKNRVTSSLPLGFFAIDGFGDANGTGGSVNTAVFDTSYKRWGFDLKLAKDIDVEGLASLTLYTGVTYFNTALSNDFNLIEDGNPFPVYQEDDIDTDYYGLLVGADVAYALNQNLFLDFGGRVELLYADAGMTARQDLYPPVLSLRVDDAEDQIAGRVEARLGFHYDLSPVVFGVGTSASYLSYQPYAEHPTAVADRFSPSHIEDDHMFSYKINISMQVAF